MKYITLIVALLISANANASKPTLADCEAEYHQAEKIITARYADKLLFDTMNKYGTTDVYEGLIIFAYKHRPIPRLTGLKLGSTRQFAEMAYTYCIQRRQW